MRIRREEDLILLIFNSHEAKVLLPILVELADDYRAKPEDLDPKARAIWYSKGGFKNAKLSAQDTEDWIEQMHGFKSANLAAIERWCQALSKHEAGLPKQIKLTLEEAHQFVTVINDQRLLLAARHDIGQTEMDMILPFADPSLSGPRKLALFQIHFLALMIEQVIGMLSGEEPTGVE